MDRTQRLRAAFGTAVLIAALAIATWHALRPGTLGAVLAAGGGEREGGEALSGAESPAAPAPGSEGGARQPLPATTEPVAGSRAAPCDSFATMLGRLVDRFAAARAAQPPDSRRSRAEWEQELGPDARRILACHQDAGELALAAVSESVGTPLAAREPMLQCAILVAATALSDCHGLARASGSRTRLDGLVHLHLTTMTLEEPLGRVIGGSVLDQARFLGAAHEARVRGFLRPDEKAPWLAPIARRLLLTLWRNLVAEGLLTREDLDRRMLVLADTGDPATRTAALLRLLESSPEQHTPWILDLIEGSDDREFVAHVAMAIAARLPGDRAAAALLRLQATRPYESLLGAWLTLGERHPEVLGATYQARLAEDVDVPTRAALICALGMCRKEQGMAALREAFAHDPALEVRGNALLALMASPVRKSGEAALQSALQDPRFTTGTTGIAYLVLALENCCTGDPAPELVAEVGRRILQLPTARPDQREKVEGLLRRFTPGR